MPRGIVLWPDRTATEQILALWAALERAGVPTLASATHGGHAPHVSLVVADVLPPDEALAAAGRVPAEPIPLQLAAAGVFPNGVLYLAPSPGEQLLTEHRRVRDAVSPLAVGAWEHYVPDRWMPHVTVSTSLDPTELATALPLVLERLPILGALDRGGWEDGATGERRPAD